MMYIYIYVCVYIYIYIYIHAYICIYTYILIHLYTYVYMYTHVHAYIYTHIYICTSIHTYIHTSIKVPHPQRKLNVVLIGNGAGPAELVAHYTKAKSKIISHRTTSFCLISSGADKTGENSRKSAGDGILKLPIWVFRSFSIGLMISEIGSVLRCFASFRLGLTRRVRIHEFRMNCSDLTSENHECLCVCCVCMCVCVSVYVWIELRRCVCIVRGVSVCVLCVYVCVCMCALS